MHTYIRTYIHTLGYLARELGFRRSQELFAQRPFSSCHKRHKQHTRPHRMDVLCANIGARRQVSFFSPEFSSFFSRVFLPSSCVSCFSLLWVSCVLICVSFSDVTHTTQHTQHTQHTHTHTHTHTHPN